MKDQRITDQMMWRFAQFLQMNSGNSNKRWERLSKTSQQRWRKRAENAIYCLNKNLRLTLRWYV